MEHGSNVKIIKASKLLTKMGNFNAEYNPKEVYNKSKQSESDNNAKVKVVQETLELLTAFAFYTTKI